MTKFKDVTHNGFVVYFFEENFMMLWRVQWGEKVSFVLPKSLTCHLSPIRIAIQCLYNAMISKLQAHDLTQKHTFIKCFCGGAL